MNPQLCKRLVLETLEDRLVPSFSTVHLDGAGNLTIIGTPRSGTLTLVEDAGNIDVVDGSSTTTFAASGNINVTFTNSLTQNRFNFDLAGGTFGGSVTLNLGSFVTGFANQAAFFGGTIEGSVTVNGSNSSDSISFGSFSSSITVNGSVYLDTKGGSDTVTMGDTHIEGNAIINNANMVTLSGSGADEGPGTTVIDGILSLNSTGEGIADTITFNPNTVVNGQAILLTGTGADSYTLSGAFGSTLTLNTGNGADSVTLGGTTLGGVLILNGTGNDSISVTGATLGNVTINAGNGNDSISLSGTQLGNSLSITTGNGNDSVSLTDTCLSHIMITMGNGNDTLAVTTAGLSGSLYARLGNLNDTVNVTGTISIPWTIIL